VCSKALACAVISCPTSVPAADRPIARTHLVELCADQMRDTRVEDLEQFPVKWAHMQDNFGNAPEQWSARQDGAARLEQALGAYREAPYGDCCDSNLHGRKRCPEHDYQLW
jgi:hypothetical protein